MKINKPRAHAPIIANEQSGDNTKKVNPVEKPPVKAEREMLLLLRGGGVPTPIYHSSTLAPFDTHVPLAEILFFRNRLGISKSKEQDGK
jgi:hypothetical protein